MSISYYSSMQFLHHHERITLEFYFFSLHCSLRMIQRNVKTSATFQFWRSSLRLERSKNFGFKRRLTVTLLKSMKSMERKGRWQMRRCSVVDAVCFRRRRIESNRMIRQWSVTYLRSFSNNLGLSRFFSFSIMDKTNSLRIINNKELFSFENQLLLLTSSQMPIYGLWEEITKTSIQIIILQSIPTDLEISISSDFPGKRIHLCSIRGIFLLHILHSLHNNCERDRRCIPLSVFPRKCNAFFRK